ncbi:MAG: phytoene desaturase family protein [Balneolaceae bacterium]|nr:phytoene desaturase family protein [Balneolaceae bacterium]
MPKKATIIGAGIGGLAAASLLAKKGYDVTVFERNSTPGGKMQQVEVNGYRFDTGPSLLTMPFILEKLFKSCDENLDDYLKFTELEPLCRYFYRDGTVFDNFSNADRTIQQIKNFAPEDADSYQEFLNYSENLYQKTADAFLFNPLYDLNDLKNLNFKDFLGIDAFSTVSKKVNEYFSSSYLRKFFKRFTTYNGSSPFKAPATLNVIPHVELNQGGYYVDGGLYKIAESLHQLAKKMGADFRFNSSVKRINIAGKSVRSVELQDGSIHKTDLLFSNADATETILNLLPDDSISRRRKAKQKAIEPSCSGFVLLLGCNKQWDQLKHHNIFFSDDYEKEFEDIFENKKMPEDPTIYIANTSYSDSGHAPEGSSNLFILINSPYVDGQNWETIKKNYSSFLIRELEERGLIGLEDSIKVEKVITPKDFYEKFLSNKGSIYGTSSNNRMAAFLRPRNKERSLKNLFMIGGSTHPGGGIPLVIQSAFNAVELLLREV